MSLTLQTPTPGSIYGSVLWYPSKCGFCLCWDDDELISNTGMAAMLTLYLSIQPTDGQDFTFQGRVYTYRNTPTLPWEITIGGSQAVTLANTALSLSLEPTINPSDYVVLPLLGYIIVAANRVGSQWTLQWLDGGSPLSMVSNVVGVNPALVATDYRVLVDLLISTSDDPLLWEVERGFAVTPRITADPTNGEWSSEMCLPVNTLVDAHITRTVPVIEDDGVAAYELHYDWLVILQPRYRRYLNGDSEPVINNLKQISFTDALCPVGVDYEPWSARNSDEELLMLVTRRGNLTYCTGTLVFLYCVVEEGTEVTINVDWTDGVIDTGATSTVTPTRDCILEVRPHGLYPIGFEGDITVRVTRAGNDYEEINFTLTGPCCGTTFYFVNRFGKYEVMQCLPEATAGVDIDALSYTTCDSCDNRATKVEYGSTYTQTASCYTPRLDLDSEEDRQFILDFFTSTEVHLLLPDRTLERVVLDRGSRAVRDTASQTKARFEVKYRRQMRAGN